MKLGRTTKIQQNFFSLPFSFLLSPLFSEQQKFGTIFLHLRLIDHSRYPFSSHYGSTHISYHYSRVPRRVPSTIRGLLLFQALRRLISRVSRRVPRIIRSLLFFGRYVASILRFLAASPVPFAAYYCFRRYVAFIFGFLAASPVPFAAYSYSRALRRLYFRASRLLSQISAIISSLSISYRHRPHYISHYSCLLCGPRL